tara:strand:- start:110 stop:1021 length:912 start_codon:yes stop_codon:yes gene_type:complete
MTKEKSQKDMITFISNQKKSINDKIEKIVNGSVESQKLSIEGGVGIYNVFKNKIILTNPKEKKHTALIDYFKKDVCNGVLGQTYEYFTRSNIKKAELENMTGAEQTKAEQNKVYKVGSLKGRTFLNFCKIGYFLKDTDGLYRAEPNKNGQLLIKMSAVKKLKAEKNQSFWDSKIDNVEYALFSYNDCIRAYLTLFGVSRENQNDKSKAFNLMQDLINLVNESDIEKFMSVNYDIFIADELNNNESKISQLINLLTNVIAERAEQHTKGQGNKNKYDVISEHLFTEYKKIKNNVETYEPIKKVS